MTADSHRLELRKADGRRLWLYGREPITADPAPMPGHPGPPPDPHLRWHPLRGEWVVYAGDRQHRTFLPVENPLAPTTDPARPTELPSGNYEIAVFENRFPSLAASARSQPELGVPTRPANGRCEVVVYGQDPQTPLSRLPLSRVELLIDVWADRFEALSGLDEVGYVFAFENRGVEVGVTLHHPHGQIYAYPFVPPVCARQLEQERSHYDTHGRSLVAAVRERECDERQRIVFECAEAVAFVPTFARYAYETWVVPRGPADSFAALPRSGRRGFARALRAALAKLDALWRVPMPYIMVFYQAPCDGAPHPEVQVHAQIYPAYRMPGRLKYLAGSEIGAGVFTADTLPERTAAELAAVTIQED